ncbi:MAG: hypothetical protein NVS2B2_39140 [Ktedonobacteraceae bacterium]
MMERKVQFDGRAVTAFIEQAKCEEKQHILAYGVVAHSNLPAQDTKTLCTYNGNIYGLISTTRYNTMLDSGKLQEAVEKGASTDQHAVDDV